MLNKYVNILGQKTEIFPISAKEKAKLYISERLMYSIYRGMIRGVNVVFVEPTDQNPSPRTCKVLTDRLNSIFNVPIVFLLKPSSTNERNRLIEKNVYFVISDKYANLPMLVVLEHTTNKKSAKELTPVAQYMLLFHLEIRSLNGSTAKDISKFMPYSYESVTLGLTCLSDLDLCVKEKSGQRSKTIRFLYSGKDLWDKAQGLLFSPVEKTVYCDGIIGETNYPICGINALSHYTMLNSDPEKWYALTSKEYKALQKEDRMVHPNEFDGNYILEIWKYPPVSLGTKTIECVDNLSLALSLRDNDDPRVEKELERMINEMQWKD